MNKSKLAPGLAALANDIEKRYRAENNNPEVIPPFLSMGFNGTWVFLTDVLPRAIRKYGGVDPEALRKAALETDIPEGGTIQGYGVKFLPPGDPMAGQNSRATMPVMQYVGKKPYIVSPAASRSRDPVIPLPKDHGFAAN